jgi:endonuclease/exonuclease/phosphatase family metal-dependent hydrolase
MRQRWLQYELVAKLANRNKSKNVVLMGDFNTTGYNLQNEDFVQFENLMKTAGLQTTSASLRCTSYWDGGDGDEIHQSSILDHVIVEQELAASIQNVSVGSHCAMLECRDATPTQLGVSYQSVSDHCPIQVTFR